MFSPTSKRNVVLTLPPKHNWLGITSMEETGVAGIFLEVTQCCPRPKEIAFPESKLRRELGM